MEKQEFISKIQKVADILGYEMTVPEESFINQAELKKDNIWIHIRNGVYQNEQKIKISGSYPRDCHNQDSSYGLENPSIRCSQDKTPEQIARDIQKRFLPDYMEDLQKVIEQNKTIQEKADTKYHTIKALADFLGISPEKDHNNEYSLPIWNVLPGLGSLKVSYDGTEINLNLELTLDQTLQVLAILK
ncbi:MAG: hypothetical protein WA066_02805 [Candidatus Omnitrophota bacterium]